MKGKNFVVKAKLEEFLKLCLQQDLRACESLDELFGNLFVSKMGNFENFLGFAVDSLTRKTSFRIQKIHLSL